MDSFLTITAALLLVGFLSSTASRQFDTGKLIRNVFCCCFFSQCVSLSNTSATRSRLKVTRYAAYFFEPPDNFLPRRSMERWGYSCEILCGCNLLYDWICAHIVAREYATMFCTCSVQQSITHNSFYASPDLSTGMFCTAYCTSLQMLKGCCYLSLVKFRKQQKFNFLMTNVYKLFNIGYCNNIQLL